MSRNGNWWGAAPLLVGASGLLLMAFGAKGLPDSGEINTAAKKGAETVEKLLNHARNREEVIDDLQEAEEALRQEGKAVDLQSLAPRRGPESDSDWIGRVRDAFYDARSDHRDPRCVVAGRIAFYCGLILVFAAGVLLYRRTPKSVYKEW
jgi:hypothetical protein